ncbi:hypothetical protein [Nocardioides sp. cx-173]|uniref:hypothetical protein n=1 Tax=Nocardioides sp. cx-173 TaxID=2898796 RepID=UPI001E29680A|nr:hypothetical protein [Nocardioides sp. cx-173]MCD4526403.1 hypothetical protein [Nocardioides sp. cx-173]UGB43574.1 hypothetical protein LQ940_08610 [Nocardioides sp. cx-173]
MAESSSIWRTWAGPWRSAAGAVALVLIAGQAVWRGVLLGRGFFTQDDYLMLRLGAEPLSWGMLTQDYSGHFFPGGFLFAWAHAHHAPLDWGVVVVEILLMQAVAAVLLWMVLCRMLPGSWARVPLLAVGLACPLALWPTQWWAVAIQFLPISICLLLAVWALLVHLQEGRRWALPAVLAATAAGLLFQERAALFPVVLGLIACAFSPVSGPRAIVAALRSRLLTLWAPLAVLLGGYLVLHRATAPIEATSAGSTGGGLELVGNFVFRNAVPGFVGGPWTPTVLGDSLLMPPTYAVVLAWLVVGSAVVWTVVRARPALWGWLLLAVYALIDVGLLFAGRSMMGGLFGLIPRYAADMVPVLPVALALVVRAVLAAPASVPRARRLRVPRPPGAVVAVGLTLAYVASAAVTTAAVASYSYNDEDRRYVETLRAELRDQPDAVIFDGRAPDGVMIGWFADDARVSTMVGIAPESPVFDLPSHRMRMVGSDGRLRPIDLVASARSEPTDDEACGYPITRDGGVIPLAEPMSGERMVARISYYTAAKGMLRVAASGDEQAVPLRGGLNVVDLVVRGDVDALEMSLLDEDAGDEVGTVCVVAVEVGYPVPRD